MSASANPGSLHDTVVAEVAELARREIAPLAADEGGDHGPPSSVFFLVLSPSGQPALWVGPDEQNTVVAALSASSHPAGAPFSLQLPGSNETFRVSAASVAAGGRVFLGLIDRQAEHMLHDIAITFAWLWAGMVLFGLLVARFAAKRILGRVDAVTLSVARLGTEDLSLRISDEPRRRDEISRLISTFNQMLARVEAGVQSIRTLADALAHDLKSPLTTIRGNLELALTANETMPASDEIGRSIEGIDRLLRALDASLDATEAEAGALRLQRVSLDLGALAEEMAELYRPAAEERGLQLDFRRDGETTILADAGLFGRALGNLLDNAVAHLPAGSRVTLAVLGTDDGVRLEIEDDGPGFPAEVRERAFERFAKGPASTGHGLGLAIVRAAAEAHGGTVTLAPGRKSGARIALEFPRA